MNKVCVVSSYVPLQVRHLSAEAYRNYGRLIEEVSKIKHQTCFFWNFPFEQCWLMRQHPEVIKYKPATDTPADRYATTLDHVKSNIVQHSRTEWALHAAQQNPDVDVVVWLDLGILKQGAFRNNIVTTSHVAEFLDKVARYDFVDVPFPGITTPREPINPYGNNWRFCGSTHIWPVKWLKQIDECYRRKTLGFIHCFGCIPLDLAIWPLVERDSGVPFKFYQAEYDASQLTEFPCAS